MGPTSPVVRIGPSDSEIVGDGTRIMHIRRSLFSVLIPRHATTMSTNSSAIQQLDPLASMALLPLDAAYQATVAAYVVIGTVGDILLHVGSTYQLLFRYRITAPTVIDFLSKTSTLVYVVANIVFQITLRPECLLYHVASSATALLFLRIRAVFNRDTLALCSHSSSGWQCQEDL